MLKDSLNSVKIERALPVVDQLSQQVRALIKEERFPAGSKLPSTAEMARMWESDAKTVHGAMTRLVKEGLIYRKPGSGTFVREKSTALTKVAIYYQNTSVRSRGSFYIHSLQEALAEVLKEKGIEMSILTDPRSGEEAKEPWELLVTAARRREFQGLIVPVVDSVHLPWLLKLPVSSVFQAVGDFPNKVDFDDKQFAELSLGALLEKGCRSVGLICHPGRSGAFAETLVDTARALGLEILGERIRPEEVLIPPRDGESYDHSQERLGYEKFNALWLLDQKPDGLVVYPDTFVRGVLFGVAEKGVRVPGDLKLVLHRNAGIGLFCPLAADFVVSDEREVAKALVNQLERLFHGESISPQTVPFQLIKSPARVATAPGSSAPRPGT
jgi:DNA-binding LacI/PurR family transcriptional regulator